MSLYLNKKITHLTKDHLIVRQPRGVGGAIDKFGTNVQPSVTLARDFLNGGPAVTNHQADMRLRDENSI